MMLEVGVAPSWEPEVPWRNPLSSAEASVASLHAVAPSPAAEPAGKAGAGPQRAKNGAAVPSRATTPKRQRQPHGQSQQQEQQQQHGTMYGYQGVAARASPARRSDQLYPKTHSAAAAAATSSSWDTAPGFPLQPQYPQVGRDAAAGSTRSCIPVTTPAARSAVVNSKQPLVHAGTAAAPDSHAAAALYDQGAGLEWSNERQLHGGSSPIRGSKLPAGAGKRSRVRSNGRIARG